MHGGQNKGFGPAELRGTALVARSDHPDREKRPLGQWHKNVQFEPRSAQRGRTLSKLAHATPVTAAGRRVLTMPEAGLHILLIVRQHLLDLARALQREGQEEEKKGERKGKKPGIRWEAPISIRQAQTLTPRQSMADVEDTQHVHIIYEA